MSQSGSVSEEKSVKSRLGFLPSFNHVFGMNAVEIILLYSFSVGSDVHQPKGGMRRR
jgi:hypothetical protein